MVDNELPGLPRVSIYLTTSLLQFYFFVCGRHVLNVSPLHRRCKSPAVLWNPSSSGWREKKAASEGTSWGSVWTSPLELSSPPTPTCKLTKWVSRDPSPPTWRSRRSSPLSTSTGTAEWSATLPSRAEGSELSCLVLIRVSLFWLSADYKSSCEEATASIPEPNTSSATTETELICASTQNQVTFICRSATRQDYNTSLSTHLQPNDRFEII